MSRTSLISQLMLKTHNLENLDWCSKTFKDADADVATDVLYQH